MKTIYFHVFNLRQEIRPVAKHPTTNDRDLFMTGSRKVFGSLLKVISYLWSIVAGWRFTLYCIAKPFAKFQILLV